MAKWDKRSKEMRATRPESGHRSRARGLDLARAEALCVLAGLAQLCLRGKRDPITARNGVRFLNEESLALTGGRAANLTRAIPCTGAGSVRPVCS